MGYVCHGPQPAIVGFHDRTADRESHTHAAGFGGEEGIEQPVLILGGNPDAAIRPVQSPRCDQSVTSLGSASMLHSRASAVFSDRKNIPG